jgi:serine/threonine-protein kinase RsbW
MATRTFSGRFVNLAAIREFVGNLAAQAGLSTKGVYEVQLAVDEACSNIIEHGYGEESAGDIECTCEIDTQGITLKLRDWAPPFTPGEVDEPDLKTPLEKVKIRGAGLVLIHKLMDQVTYEDLPEKGNLLTLVKYK